jgi:hypothetical protein
MGGFGIKRKQRYVKSPNLQWEREVTRDVMKLIMCFSLQGSPPKNKDNIPNGTIRGSKICSTNRIGGTDHNAEAAYRACNHEPTSRMRAPNSEAEKSTILSNDHWCAAIET